MVLFTVVGQFLFSCSSAEYYRFTSAKPETYNRSVAKVEPADQKLEEAAPAVLEEEKVVTAAEMPAQVKQVEPVLEASAKKAEPVLFETKKTTVATTDAKAASAAALSVEETKVLDAAKHRLASMTKAERKEFKKEVKTALRDANASTNIVEIILAILLPPLGVFLHEGDVNSRFWISLLLTLLFFIPGVIYALLVVTDSI